jgi:hypothetical protein
VGCVKAPTTGAVNTTLTPDTHTFFPIVSGPHAVTCNTCHGGSDSFQGFSCFNCHGHDVQSQTDQLHIKVACGPGQTSGCYTYESSACYSCHTQGARQAFDHFGVTGNCASCHDVNANFAALPVPGFTHIPITQDCGGCHSTSSWQNATGAPAGLKSDPTRDLILDAGIPSYVGTSIASIATLTEDLPMPMNHATTSIDGGVLQACTVCHATASNGQNYYPGIFHTALAAAGLPQPTTCQDCHATSMPTGFVGPQAQNPVRNPPSGEMKHDAVGWVGGTQGTMSLVTADCSVCHVSPGMSAASFATAQDGGTPAVFHASLTSASLAQPGSCLDCHANSRPEAVLTNGTCPAGDTCQQTSNLPANVQFDHTTDDALADCASCHGASAPSFASWAGAKFHAAGSATPTSCLPCHAAERPTSNTGWTNPNYQSSPFDYGTNSLGITHGAGLDCVTCHTGPGTGSWGSNQNWATGTFQHGPGTASADTCISCHSSQRPDLVLGVAAANTALGFDHSINGNGDCYGCHQATVAAGTYVHYDNPSTNTLPGGDWQGGLNYPGNVLIGSNTQFVTITEITLVRAATGNPNNLVTSTTSTQATLYNEMLHTSAQIPPELQPALPDGGVINDSCWHCHTHDPSGIVTAYKDGEFHASINNYTLTPDGGSPVTTLAQPSTGCGDCHNQMRPAGIVELNGSDLTAMDHSAMFVSPVTIDGGSVSGAGQMDCSDCHNKPGVSWDGGVFHANIAGAVPKDCTICHYPLMADWARSNADAGVLYFMSHKSGQMTFQSCDTCHVAAEARETTTPVASTLFSGGTFHANLAAQPTKCNDCHTSSEPKANASTQSSHTYTLTSGSTSSNQGQWMNHGAATVTGLDCVICHASDAAKSGSAWSKSDTFHNVSGVTTPTTCQGCHGLNNGSTVAGTNNNLPSGLTNSTTVTSAASDSTTGIASGTLDQITHSDINVSGHDCNFCHTQVGMSSVSGISGKEWAQASFHKNFTGASSLTMNGTTGRCSNCHMNVVPGSSFTGHDHSGLSNASGTTDCNSCHSTTGTGTASSPNWLGASGGAPTCFDAGGFTIPDPPAANNTTIQSGDACLSHPALSGTESCTSCHTSSSGGTGAFGYDHAATAQSCTECHEAGSDLVGTVWNKADGGSGDTRPIDYSYSKSCSSNNHFYSVDCSWCHTAPSGLAKVTNYASSSGAGNWSFHHPSKNGTCSTNCKMCHCNGCPN